MEADVRLREEAYLKINISILTGLARWLAPRLYRVSRRCRLFVEPPRVLWQFAQSSDQIYHFPCHCVTTLHRSGYTPR
jgi:hypothetical protein